MGIFHFFKKKQEVTPIAFEELGEWLDKYVERQEMGTKLGIIKREIGSKTSKLKELLEILEHTQPKNPDILPEREINMMEGNKKRYIQKIRTFISSIEFPEKYVEVTPFLIELSDNLATIAVDTQKNFFILKEFMENEVRAVANKLSEMDNVISSARSTLEDTALEDVKEIKNKISEYYDTEQEIYSLRKEAEKIEERKSLLFEKKSKIEDKVSKLMVSTGYEQLKKLKEKEEKTKELVKETEKKVFSLFSDITPAIKKYHNKVKDPVLKEYLSDSVKAFINDESVKIYGLLKKIEKDILSLELKDTKREKIEKRLSKINDEELKKLKDKFLSLKEELKDIKNRIKNHSANLNLKEQQGWVESIDKDLKIEDEKLNELEMKLERRNLNLMKQKINEMIKKLDSDVEIRK